MLDEITRLKKQINQLQLKRDILTKTNELIKKDMGIRGLILKNREKNQVVDDLKEIYSIAERLCVLKLARR